VSLILDFLYNLIDILLRTDKGKVALFVSKLTLTYSKDLSSGTLLLIERIHAAKVIPAMIIAAINFWASGIVAIISLNISTFSLDF
jgi:hypothetical protein